MLDVFGVHLLLLLLLTAINGSQSLESDALSSVRPKNDQESITRTNAAIRTATPKAEVRRTPAARATSAAAASMGARSLCSNSASLDAWLPDCK
mmetsp:Transcript_95073/g.183298  ORF Transcript_95073/g.183298 Transcript_95073/m.183298 type:complete len:94 (-) Transcript_95073:711-992(-)